MNRSYPLSQSLINSTASWRDLPSSGQVLAEGSYATKPWSVASITYIAVARPIPPNWFHLAVPMKVLADWYYRDSERDG